MRAIRWWIGGLAAVILSQASAVMAQQPVNGPLVIPQAMPAPANQMSPTYQTGSSSTAPMAPAATLPAVPAAHAGATLGAIQHPVPPTTPPPSACNGGQGTALGAGKAHIQLGQYGRGCANGCGSFAGNCGFIFGSCRSFFDPCGPLPLGCKKCPISPFGHPYGTGANRCTYDSYLNH
ncbi:MAG: hypothetical protein NZU63_03600 [Gemmataceae bacterium]|nr:hypothetical protein [Gemmataceae bacterium]MDW8242724.1 hypothetical protein [Thermogemmata sp.]